MYALGSSSYNHTSHHCRLLCAPLILHDAIRKGCGLDTTQAFQYHARCSFATRGTISTLWNLTVHVRQGWAIWPSEEFFHVKKLLWRPWNGHVGQCKILHFSPLFRAVDQWFIAPYNLFIKYKNVFTFRHI